MDNIMKILPAFQPDDNCVQTQFQLDENSPQSITNTWCINSIERRWSESESL